MAPGQFSLTRSGSDVVSSFGLKLVDVAIVDVRSKIKSGAKRARSDMQRRVDRTGN